MNDDSAGQTISRRAHRPLLTTLMMNTALCLGALATVLPIPQAAAQTARTHSFNIPSQPLNRALRSLADQTGVQIAYQTSVAAGATAPAVAGMMSTEQALTQLLSGSGLRYSFTNANTVTILGATAPGGESIGVDGSIVLDTITVQGEKSTAMIGNTPPPYAGGQVATGGQLGLLGNRSIFDTPFNTTSFTDKTIRDQGATSIGDVLANDPSARVLSSQANGGETFYIRGFSVANSNVAFGGLYGIYPYWKGSIASAERVEVLKGPGALLFGMSPGGAVGGTVNIVPKQAGETPLARITGNYLSDSNFGGQVDVARRFGTNNEFGIRFNGVFRDGDSYRDTSQRQGEATLGLDYQGDRVRLSADLGYLNLRYSGTEGAIFPGTDFIPAPPKPNKQIFQPWTYYNSQTWYGVLRGEVDITDNVTAYAAIGGRRYKDQYLLPYGSGLLPNGDFTENFLAANEYWNSYSTETGIRARFDTGPIQHKLSVAASRFSQTSGGLNGSLPSIGSNIYNPSVVSQPPLPSFGALPKTAETGLNSFAIADTLSAFDERLQLTLGVRYQNVTAKNFNSRTGALVSDYNESAWTPAIGLVVKPWENVSFYANYIEGLTQGVIAPTGSANAGEVFPPMVSRQIEAGVKVDWAHFATTVSVFDITQPSAFNDPNTNRYVVDGRQRNQGVEFNIFGELADNVRVLGGAMLLRPELEDTADHAFDGNSPTNAPKASINLGFEWDTPFISGLTLTARGIYTSPVYVNQANTQKLDDWTRFDVGARYTFDRQNGKPITISANVTNVFNESYWQSSSLYRGAPRTFTLSASFEF
ncbi:TonB-dependent siderophore receptor [Chelatococcus sp. GCM10030263]|uniref:TonB-dependent siderophore receptor n=1 Tax=Chelatococcus sp. GCM10030263 TaxID=3273387 RepID=UPI0036150BE8